MVELIFLPFPLAIVYAGVILGCGAALGTILGRRFPLAKSAPRLQLEGRVEALEHELETSERELRCITDENEFLRELSKGRARDDG